MRTVMEHQFSRAPQGEIPRSSFNRSHGHKTAFDAGFLIPIYVDEGLPGDVFRMNLTAFARLATPIFPVMDNMYMDFFFFSVPNRLLWVNWRKFLGEQTDPGDSIDFTIPTFAGTITPTLGSIYDYMGIPLAIVQPASGLSALPFRAYNFIWNEWFRDQNLQDSVTVLTDNGTDILSTYSLLRRGKRHDYFTSALPFPQKGDAVSIPLGTAADVGVKTGWSPGDDVHVKNEDIPANWVDMNSGVPTKLEFGATAAGTANLYADLTNAAAATINQLRQSFQIQKLLERDARGGTRMAEIIKSHFGVEFQDVRYRPEYLGGGSVSINVSAVQNNSGSAGDLGDLAGFGVGAGSGIGFTKAFDEHCTILGLVSVRADLTYSQGLERMWNRSTRYDYFWPALSTIGEQTILNKELWSDGSANDLLTFGYQERYAEYRYKPSRISGIMRPDAAGTLAAWHLSQDFATLPALNDAFIQDNPPIDRVIATPADPHFIFDSYFDLRCARPMPLYGIPGMIDHF